MTQPQTPSPLPPPQPVARSGRHPRAHRPFFLAAALYGALAVPLWVAEWNGTLPGCGGCDPVARHAHEMLLGFAGAVLGGFLFTKVSRPQLVLALVAWLAARLGAWAGIGGVPGTVLALAYPACLFGFGGWPFFKAAKVGHNMVFAPVIAAFVLAETLYQGGRLGLIEAGERRGVLTAFDLVALMILVMGGRVVPAAMAGLVRREESRELFDRNRVWLEWLVVAGLGLAALADALMPELPTAPAMALAGIAALMRQARWRPAVALRDASMGPVQVGYSLLAAGLVLAAIADWTGMGPTTDALHLATVGGIGMVTAAMMLRITHIRERRPGPMPRAAVAIAVTLALAADLRVTAAFAPDYLIPASAAWWSLSFLALAVALVLEWRRPERALM
jgi:uncharacterized protein involved in response to NO